MPGIRRPRGRAQRNLAEPSETFPGARAQRKPLEPRTAQLLAMQIESRAQRNSPDDPSEGRAQRNLPDDPRKAAHSATFPMTPGLKPRAAQPA